MCTLIPFVGFSLFRCLFNRFSLERSANTYLVSKYVPNSFDLYAHAVLVFYEMQIQYNTLSYIIP